MSSSRASAAPPLRISPSRATASPVSGTPGSADSMNFSDDGYYYAPSTATAEPLLWEGRGSPGSNSSAGMTSLKKVKSPRKVNAHSYCGRHSDEYLFGGKGLGDLWRAVTKK
ncbi:hypothetical protein MMYC01_207073 [Madurella mycetomatis]|uniref:Uncharacterized protein n=1 Tax=Madurella mycetomatis TaxID=100816 RepID=A0A175VUQ6_9PEZI|nr:hypothetical protein MMYC01_207073 [Madurella mycetomatis]